MKYILLIIVFLMTVPAKAERYPLLQQSRDILCLETLSQNRRIKPWEGIYIDEDGKTKNIFQDLNKLFEKIEANDLVSKETKIEIKKIKLEFANFYQCNSSGNPIPEKKNKDLEQTLSEYNQFCLITKDGIKKYTLSSLQEYIKNISGLGVVPVGWVYNSYFRLATAALNSSVLTSPLGASDQSRIESLIFQRGLPKSNLKLSEQSKKIIQENCPDAYVNSLPVKRSIPRPVIRKRPGSR